MNCPLCKADTFVLQTDAPDRRRQCTRCGHRFSTTEVLKDELARSERIIADAQALADRIKAAA